MPFDLEQHLQELCDKHTPKLNLYDRLVRIRISADSIWEEQRLKWFTDHRAQTHSRYIIKHLGSVLENLQSTEQRLNPHELFVLLAACYFHDIGMQDFQSYNGRSVDQFIEEDYKRIRKNHPEKARDLIIKRTLTRERDEFRIDLDYDPQYLVPIALVSQGHGSDYFFDTINEFNVLPHRPGNMPFRGGLLTALLLIADELDLHEQRATFPREFTLSPVSLLHHHIHHYITGVDIIDGRTPKHRRFRLTFEFPQDSDEYRNDVRNWVTTKLRKQIKLTNSLVANFTQGELVWDDQIEVHETIDRYGVRRSLLAAESMHALHELRRDLISAQTVNRDELIESFREKIKNGIYHFNAVQIIDRDDSDWSHIAKHLKAICICNGIIYIHFGFQMASGHGISDLLYRISCELEKLGCPCSNYNDAKESVNEIQEDLLAGLGNTLISDIKTHAEDHPLVIILERIDRAEPDTLHWIEEWLLQQFTNHDIKSIVVLTMFQDDGLEIIRDNIDSFKLNPFTTEQIMKHLQDEFGYLSDEAENEAEYLFSLSAGMSGRIHLGFSRKRIEGVKVI